MVSFNVQHGLLIKECYRHVIDEIMLEYGITPWPGQSRPQNSHIVEIGTNFERAVQHTDSFTGRHDTQKYYRYNRYMRELRRHVKPGIRRVAHIDIGCGAGLFSWVLLDWATENGLGHDRVDLYGYDYSPAMIRLAVEIRLKLVQVIPSYPSLYYDHDIDAFLHRLKMAWRPDTDYIITFGHVLVQSYARNRSSIEKSFAQIIDSVMKLQSAGSTCELIAVDARGASIRLTEGWKLLLDSLGQHDILHRSDYPKYSMYASLTTSWGDDDDLPW